MPAPLDPVELLLAVAALVNATAAILTAWSRLRRARPRAGQDGS